MHRRVAVRGVSLVSRALGLLWPARRSGRARVAARRRSRRRLDRPDRTPLVAGQQLEPRLALWAQVAASSIADGDVLGTGSLAYVVTFSEAMDPASLTAPGSFLIYDGLSRQYLDPVSVTPSTDALSRSVATVVFAPLSESRYDLEIIGPTDLAGVPLGGPGTTVPWSVQFSTDAATTSFGPLAAAAPLGALVHGSASRQRTVLASPADVDDVRITLAPGGSLLSAVVESASSLQARVEVLGADGVTVLASRSATRPGERMVVGPVDVAAGGTYTFRYSALAGTTGAAETSLLLGAIPESEVGGAHTNDSPAGAESLAESLATVGSARRQAVAGALGSNVVVASDGFEGGVLGGAWAVSSSQAGGRLEVSQWERSSGFQSLLMDQSDPLATVPNLNQAVLSVDLSRIAGSAILDFAHLSAFDGDDAFAGPFTGQFNADGVAISADGVTWHPVWSATGDEWSWGSHSVNLSAAAASAGIPLGAGFRIKFQQYGIGVYDGGGRFWDDIAVRDHVADVDTYAIPLAAGETLSAYLDSEHDVEIALLDPDGTVVAGGAAQGDFASIVTEYSAPAAGTYRLVVTSPQAAPLAGDLPYTLVTVAGGLLEIESNDRRQTAQPLPAGGTVLGFLGGRETVVDGFVDVPGDPLALGFDALGHFGGVEFGMDWAGSEFGFLSTWTLQLAGTNYNTQDRQGIVSTVSFPVVVTVRTEGDTSLVRVNGQPRTGVSFERLVSWRAGDDHAVVTTTIRNASAAAITGVKLLESHNPDPAYAFETANDVTRGGRVAVGTAFGLSMGLATGDSRATLSVEGAAALDGLLAVNPDDVLGTPVDPAGATADTALNLAFNFGTVAAGGSATGTFAILFGNGQAAVESLYDRLDIAPVVWDDVDTYAITADAGQRLLLQTRTPGTAAGDVPDVRLELLDHAGSVLASDDNGAADGRNAVLAHQFAAAGTYYLRVSASPAATALARGSYVLGTAAPTIGTSGAFVGVATTYGTASGTTQISVTGSLLEGAITATAPGHFEVSSDGVTFGPTATFSPVGGSVSGTAYVRLSATASAGTHAGDVSFASSNATGVTAALPTGTVSPKALSISGLSATSRAYDGTTAASITGTPAYDGLVAADAGSFTVVKGTAVAAFADPNAGEGKTVTVTGYQAPSSNYTVADPSLTATITRRAASITGAAAAQRRVYDGSTGVAVRGGSLAGILTGDAVTLSDAGAVGTVASPNAGTNLPVTVTGYSISGPSAANYDVVQPTGLVTTITAKPVTITGAKGLDRAYDRTVTVAIDTSAASIVGLVPGDAVAIGGAPVGTMTNATVGANKPLTVTGVALTGTAAGNYGVAQPAGLKASITQAALTIVGLSGGSRVYSGAAVRTATVTGTPTLSGVFAGDTVGIVSGTYSFADGNAGTGKPITAAGFAINGTSSANYRLAAQPAPTPGTITPKALTITGLVGVSRVYDGTTAATFTGTPAYSGLVAADGLSATPVSGTPVATFADKNAGTLKNVTVSGYTAPTANYSVTAPTLKASITQATVTITGVTAVGRTYDGTTAVQLAGGTAVGLLTADVAAGSVALGATGATGKMATAAASATAKPVTVTGFALEGADAANYKVTQPTGVTVLIAKRNVTVTGLTANGKTYNNSTTATVSGTATLQNVVAGESLSLGGTPVFRFAQAGVGTNVAVTTTGYTLVAGPGAAVANYNLVMPVLSADITQAVLTVKANSFTVARGAAIPSLTYTITGLAAGDLAANTYAGLPSLATSATRTSLAGAYVITVAPGTLSLLTTTGKKGGNYVFAFVDGSVTIL